MTLLTTAEVAERFRCSPRKVREVAVTLGVGVALGGRAGYRFSEADVLAIQDSLRPKAPVQRRRRRAS